MGTKLEKINSFQRSIYDCSKKVQYSLTKSDIESITPPGTKGMTEVFQANDLFNNSTEEQKEIFNKWWINDLLGDDHGEQFDGCYKTLKEYGYGKEEAKKIISFAIENALRAKSSAHDNESFGRKASTATTANILLGLFKELIDTENTPWIINTALHLAYGITRSIRSYCQYSITTPLLL